MEPYNVHFKPTVEKDLRLLPKALLHRVFQRIEALRLEPFPRQALKLVGAERLYRVRVGEYRIIYEVDTPQRHLTIHHIRHRRDVYRDR